MDAVKTTIRADDLISFQQVAEAANVTRQTVGIWIESQRIPVYRQGDMRKRFILREDAEKLLRPQAGRTQRVSA